MSPNDRFTGNDVLCPLVSYSGFITARIRAAPPRSKSWLPNSRSITRGSLLRLVHVAPLGRRVKRKTAVRPVSACLIGSPLRAATAKHSRQYVAPHTRYWLNLHLKEPKMVSKHFFIAHIRGIRSMNPLTAPWSGLMSPICGLTWLWIFARLPTITSYMPFNPIVEPAFGSHVCEFVVFLAPLTAKKLSACFRSLLCV